MAETVLTLIAPPYSEGLSRNVVDMISAFMVDPVEPVWLSEREACDLVIRNLNDEDIELLKHKIAASLDTLPIDFAIQPNRDRKKKLLVADMDSTIIQQECIDELGDFAGLKNRISQITEQAMQGKIEFENAFRERVGLLKGIELDMLDRVISERIVLTQGARILVQTMRANGAYCALVSGGFSFFTSRVAKMAGFHVDHANELEAKDGKLTGTVREPVLGPQAKLDALVKYRDEKQLLHMQTMAVGDGANDLAMIKEAGLGIAYRAKPIVSEQAHARIDYGDLTALLYLQGYKKADFRE